MNKFKVVYLFFMTVLFFTFVFLTSSYLNRNQLRNLEVSNSIIGISYDSDDRVLALGNKLSYILEADKLKVNEEIDAINFQDDDITKYLINALFYQVADVDFFDLDYVDVCTSNPVLGCVEVENNPSGISYGISVSSLKNYANVLFDRHIEYNSDFSYKDGDFIYPYGIINKDIRLLFDKYSINNNGRYYYIEYSGYLDTSRVTYSVILEVIGKEDIYSSTFDDISFKYIKRIK